MTVEQILQLGLSVPQELRDELAAATSAYEAACERQGKHRRETARWMAAREAIERLHQQPLEYGLPRPQTTEEAARRGWDHYYR